MAKSNNTHEARIARIEKAIIQLNHASEVAEEFIDEVKGWEIPAFKGEVSAELRWMKYLLGIGVASGVLSGVAQIIVAFKGGVP